jgi:hypothetical protein
MINSPSEPIPAVPARYAAGLPDPASGPPGPSSGPSAGAYHCREVVDQAVTPNDFPRLISLVRTLAPDTGSARELGDGLQWEQNSGYSSLSLTINPEPTGTVIRADLRTDGQQVAYVLGAVGIGLLASFIATAVHLPVPSILGIGLGALAAGGWVARGLWRASNRRQADRLQQLVAKIAAGLRGELE